MPTHGGGALVRGPTAAEEDQEDEQGADVVPQMKRQTAVHFMNDFRVTFQNKKQQQRNQQRCLCSFSLSLSKDDDVELSEEPIKEC